VNWIKTLVQGLRQQCAHLLHLVSAACQLHAADMLALTKRLSKFSDGNNSVAVYVLISLLRPPVRSKMKMDLLKLHGFSLIPIYSWPSARLSTRIGKMPISIRRCCFNTLCFTWRSGAETHMYVEVSVIEDEVGASLKKAISAGAFQAIARSIQGSET